MGRNRLVSTDVGTSIPTSLWHTYRIRVIKDIDGGVGAMWSLDS